MGNVNGRDQREDGGGEGNPAAGGGGPLHSVRVDSVAPPPPIRFPHQVSAAASQGPSRAHQLPDRMLMDQPGESDASADRGIPVIITWNQGGNEVLVEGSWDNWRTRKTLQRTGRDYAILLVLSSGAYQYRFIVDGEWRHAHDVPYFSDEMGLVNNVLDVHEYMPENTEGVAEFEPPSSPESGYGQQFPDEEDFEKEPPALPALLNLSVQEKEINGSSSKPRHVVLNHLFMEKGWASQSLVALGLTHRFQSKYVTVVLYKALKR